MSDDKRMFINVLGLIAVVAVFVLALFTQPDPKDGLRVAFASGLVDAKVIDSGYVTWRCGRGDAYFYRVHGKNPRGDDVTATVCCGVLKDCTVRY